MWKFIRLFLCTVVAGAGSVAWGEIYQWEDEAGVVHFTDKPEKIPAKYKNRVRQREMESVKEPEPTPPPTSAPPAGRQAIAPVPVQGKEVEAQQQAMWRERLSAARVELAVAKKELADKQGELQRAHRAYLVSMDTSRIKDKDDGSVKSYALNTIGARRKAYHDLQDEVAKIEERVKALEGRLEALQAEAAAAGVPADAR